MCSAGLLLAACRRLGDVYAATKARVAVFELLKQAARLTCLVSIDVFVEVFV